MCTYKSVNHVSVYCIFKLSTDIEKNPGPIDGSKTICAPYSQGNVNVFGDNAGKQCVAMSLCALIYNTSKPITNSVDLKSCAKRMPCTVWSMNCKCDAM